MSSTTATTNLKQLNSNKVWGGVLKKFSHASHATGCEMKFNIFLPPLATETHRVPVLYWLSGLTCTEDNFMQKAGAFRAAVQHDVALVCCDTSPRGLGLPGHYNMFDYVTKELPVLVEQHFPVSSSKSIFGHSMGGHGALIAAFKTQQYAALSVYAPIAHPTHCQWYDKAFSRYLGENRDEWKQWDATELVPSYSGPPLSILIDQGDADEFLLKGQLLPEDFVAAAKTNKHLSVQYRLQAGYDHSYYFVQTFIDDHIAHHAAALKPARGKS